MISEERKQHLAQQMVSIAKQAGQFIKQQEVHTVTEKGGAANVVTDIDVKSQHLLMKACEACLPGSSFLAEEEGQQHIGDGFTWVIDPIDGTTNYLYGARHSCISLALYYRKQGLIGVVYNPYRDECFLGIQGQGSWCNDKPIHVSSHGFSEALVMVGTAPYDKSQADTIFDMIKELFLETRDIRRSGSAALDLCDLACGRVDAFYEHTLQPLDYGAGRIILENAQGKIEPMTASAFDELRPTGVICSNGVCQDDLRRVIEKHLA